MSKIYIGSVPRLRSDSNKSTPTKVEATDTQQNYLSVMWYLLLGLL